MKKSKQNKQKPVAQIYAFGLVWVLYSLFFRLSGFGAIIKCLLLAWAVSALVKQVCEQRQDQRSQKQEPEKFEKAKKYSPPVQNEIKQEKPAANSELSAVILQGRESVVRIQKLNDEIPDFRISAKLKQIEILTASIIDQVEKNEEKTRQVRQFMNYYLPTTIKLLEQYVQLQNVGLKGENIASAMERIEEMLDKVIVAFQKQLDNLFARDVMDITADIQVMEQMMEANGLTNEKDF